EDRAAALADDPKHCREAEPRAVARRLRGVERFEEMLLNRSVHSRTGVADGEHHVRAGGRARMVGDKRLIELHVRGFDRQGAPVRHRIARVQREIENHLLDLSWISAHAIEWFGRARSQVDVLAVETTEQSGHAAY